MSPFARTRLMGLIIGIALIGGGAWILVPPLVARIVSIGQVDQRATADNAALLAWEHGGSAALTGSVGDTATHAATCSTGSASSNAYALVRFTGLPQYAYVGVAGDGTWDLLHEQSMVHYTGTPGPGQKGNVIVAFHREPNYEHIDQLGAGETVTIQDRTCHVYVYTIVQRWDIAPAKVTQLSSTTGHNLTLITCTPFWQDYNRLVWRANLTSIDGVAFKD